MNSFQDRLNEALLNRGISKAELAKRTGIGRNSITDYTKGKYEAKQDNVLSIANALDVNPAWLLGYNVPKNEKEKLISDAVNDLTDSELHEVIKYIEFLKAKREK